MYFHLKFFLFLFIFFFGEIPSSAQQVLEVQLIDQDANFFKKNINYNQAHRDSFSLMNELRSILGQLHAKAYLEASVDSIIQHDSLVQAFVNVGQLYEWANLRAGNVDPSLLQKVGFRERLYGGQTFHYTELVKLRESLLAFAENNGYPFATVRLKQVEIKDNQISADLFLERNRRIVFDTLKVEGKVKLSNIYLENYLGIKAGELFSLEKVKKVRQRIRELNFVKEKKMQRSVSKMTKQGSIFS